MDSNENVKIVEERPHSGSHTGMFAFLIAGLGVALIADGALWVHSNRLQDQIASNQDSTGQQISKLSDATTTLLDQRLQTINEDLSAQMKGAETSTANAMRQARAQAQKQNQDLQAKLADAQQQVSGQLDDLKDSTSKAFQAVSTDVDGVRTDVTDVKSDVNNVRTDVASTKDGLDKTSTDLKRAMGDMGVMSGLIATNGKELQALRDLGDRNYAEFDLNKTGQQKKIGDVVLTLRKADPKHNRYTVNVSADDKLVQKKDRTIDEPVQFYVHNSRQPYEIVVNQVKKDEVTGYISTPKVVLARQ